jgi:hypothetical protein
MDDEQKKEGYIMETEKIESGILSAAVAFYEFAKAISKNSISLQDFTYTYLQDAMRCYCKKVGRLPISIPALVLWYKQYLDKGSNSSNPL